MDSVLFSTVLYILDQILKLSPLSLLYLLGQMPQQTMPGRKTAQYKMLSHAINVPACMETTVRGLISLLVHQSHSYLPWCSVQTLTAPGGINDSLQIVVAIE